TRRLGVFVFASTWRLGTRLTRHKVLIRRELLLPSSIILTNLVFHELPPSLACVWRLPCCMHYQIHRTGLRIRARRKAKRVEKLDRKSRRCRGTRGGRRSTGATSV